jgi:hypothetical protein
MQERERRRRQEISRLRSWVAAVTWLALVSLTPANAVAAGGEFEPNDSPMAATGPLLAGQPVRATLETAGDRDFFFFYVAAEEGAPVTLTLAGQGGGSTPLGEVTASVFDVNGTFAGGNFAYVRTGESRVQTISLQPGKYIVEVISGSGSGQSYLLTPGSAAGTFVSYDMIASRCQAATDRKGALEKQLRRLVVKLQRAIALVRRSHYSSHETRLTARNRYLRLRNQARHKRREIRMAAKALSPWCSIPR